MTGASDDGQAGVTEADREKAAELWHLTERIPGRDGIDAIAAALAAERAKAREPFLALADRLTDEADNSMEIVARLSFRAAANLVRRAAEES